MDRARARRQDRSVAPPRPRSPLSPTTNLHKATIGITTYAAKALGDVVYVELPTVDSQVEAGEACGAVESVKSASDILSPVTGQVVEANSKLEETPGMINKSPEGEAWVARIEVGEKAREAVGGLMDEEAYKAFVHE